MLSKFALSATLAAALVVAPLSQASAHDGYYRHHGGGHVGLLALPFLAAGAVIGAAAAIATAPVRAVESPPVYAAPAYAPAYAYAPPPPAYAYGYPYGYYRR